MAILREEDGAGSPATYHRGMGAPAVRRWVSTSRPADWLMVGILLLLAWFEIWVEPIFQTGMPGPRIPLTVLSAVAITPLLARRSSRWRA